MSNIQFIKKYITINYLPIYLQANYLVFLGLERIDGTWRWFDGRTYPSEAGYGVWSSSDPNENTDCAVMHYGGSPTGSLHDLTCSYSGRRICMIQ